MNPRSNMACVCPGDDENSPPEAFIRKLASIRYPTDIELHKKLSSKRSDADPNLRAKIPPDCNPKIGLFKRWLAVKALFDRAASATLTRIAIEAVSMVAIRVFLKLWTASIPFLSPAYIYIYIHIIISKLTMHIYQTLS
jgi:hypothetical protein